MMVSSVPPYGRSRVARSEAIEPGTVLAVPVVTTLLAGSPGPEMKSPVQVKVQRYELARTIDPDHFFDTVEEAVAAFAARRGPE